MKKKPFSLFQLFPIILLWLLMVNSVSAESTVNRPKIGLALGGGSALGLAHIGVLQWFEENRIPIDYIAGTSMGGLIGGCYATGMSAGEIRSFVEGIDWNHLFNPSPPFDKVEFRRKEDDLDFSVVPQIGLRGGLKVPNGLGAYGVGIILSRISFPYSNIASFDQLPTPFRCVATDISNSNKVVMGEGSFAEALRATMAVPGVFTPVYRNGQLLVDGGVVDNLPADVAKQMGAEIVIAVQLNMVSKERPDLNNQSVLMGTINTVIENNSRESAKLADVVIEPQNGNLSVASWNQVAQFIQNGYQAAAAQAEALRKYSVDEETWRIYCQERMNRRVLTAPVPESIEVIGTNSINESKIKEHLKKYLGKPIATDALEQDLVEIMGSCLYENIRYEFQIKNHTPVLNIIVTEKSFGPPFIDFAFLVDVDSIHAEHVSINPRIRIKSFNPTGPNSELRTDIGVGTELVFKTELYQPILGSSWFIAPEVSYQQYDQSIYSGNDQISIYRNNIYQIGMDLGYAFGNSSELRIGYFMGTQNAEFKVGQLLPPGLDGDLRETRLKWSFNNTDEAFLPKKGIASDIKIRWYNTAPGSTEPFGQLETKTLKFFPIGEDLSFSLIEGGDTFQGKSTLNQKFRLGGPFHLGSYNFEQLRGDHYLLGSVGYLKLLGDYSPLGRIYLGCWLEHGGAFDSWSSMELKTDVSIGLLCSTFFGPLYFGGSYGDGSNPLFNITLGHIF